LADVGNMDLAGAISNFDQAKLFSQVQIAVAKKMLDSQKFQGGAAIKLIEAAGKTASSGADELATAATGLGAEIDTYG
jgi:hypothetical protein